MGYILNLQKLVSANSEADTCNTVTSAGPICSGCSAGCGGGGGGGVSVMSIVLC